MVIMFKSLKDMKKEEKMKRIQKEQDWLKPVLRTSTVLFYLLYKYYYDLRSFS